MQATYVAANEFTVATDRTAEFVTGRRIKADCGVDGIKYCTTDSSNYSDPNTTVTIKESELTSNLTTVLYGIVKSHVSGSLPDHIHSSSEGSGGNLSEYSLGLRGGKIPSIAFSALQATVDAMEMVFNVDISVVSDQIIHAVYVSNDPAASDDKVYFNKSTNGGVNWGSPVQVGGWSSDYVHWARISSVDADNIHVIYIHMVDDVLYHKSSTNGGANWSAQHTIATVSGTEECADVTAYSASKVFVAYDEGTNGMSCAVSTNSGIDWTPTDITGAFPVADMVRIEHVDDQTVYAVWAATSQELIFTKTIDGGTTWAAGAQVTDTDQCVCLDMSVVDEDTVVVVQGETNEVYAYQTTNGGTNWSLKSIVDNDFTTTPNKISCCALTTNNIFIYYTPLVGGNRILRSAQCTYWDGQTTTWGLDPQIGTDALLGTDSVACDFYDNSNVWNLYTNNDVDIKCTWLNGNAGLGVDKLISGATEMEVTDYYTETELDGGQLDNRYYTETEVDTNIDTASGTLQTNIDTTSGTLQTNIDAIDVHTQGTDLGLRSGEVPSVLFSALQATVDTMTSIYNVDISVVSEAILYAVYTCEVPAITELKVLFNKSINGGVSWGVATTVAAWVEGSVYWARISSVDNNNIHVIYIDADDNVLYHKSSTNGGGAWSAAHTIATLTATTECADVTAYSASTVFVVYDDSVNGMSCAVSINAGVDWTKTDIVGASSTGIVRIEHVDDQTVYAVGAGTAQPMVWTKTINGGTNWSNSDQLTDTVTPVCMDISVVDEDTVVIVFGETSNVYAYRTINGGAIWSWTPSIVDDDFTTTPNKISCCAITADNIFVYYSPLVGGNRILRSAQCVYFDDASTKWTLDAQIGADTALAADSVSCDFIDADHVWNLYVNSDVDVKCTWLNGDVGISVDKFISGDAAGVTGWVDDGENFRLTVTGGIVTDIGTTVSGGYYKA